jgi:hypothetical protein
MAVFRKTTLYVNYVFSVEKQALHNRALIELCRYQHAAKGEHKTMINELFNELYERTVRTYLDVLIMQELKNNSPKNTNQLMDTINAKYSCNVSWGLLFAALISIQKNGLINEVTVNQRSIYGLSVDGEQKVAMLADFTMQLKEFLKNIGKAAIN